MENSIKISVRRLVEHVFLSGNIETGLRNASSLIEGTKIHQDIQKEFLENSQKEVYLQTEVINEDLTFFIHGRCDGLHFNDAGVVVEEIKSTSMSLHDLDEEAYPVHWAQAFFYGYIYARDHNLDSISIKLTYVQKQTRDIHSFYKNKTISELEKFVTDVVEKYTPFARLQMRNKDKRNETSHDLAFPFANFRKSQRSLSGIVYKAIRDEKDAFIEAPTGIGKTISTTFPAVKAIGEELVDRIIYLTARNTTRETAEDAFKRMEGNGLNIRSLTITAKEKICFKDETICNPEHCEFAKGHYDRVNEAILDILDNENVITRSVIETYARKHRVCPFEYSLDLAYLADAIICDYNYIFDPQVSLKRLFEDQKKDSVLLVDESHNLVDRAREMYSVKIWKSHFLQLKRDYKDDKELHDISKNINDFLLGIKKELSDQKEHVAKEIPEELITRIEEFIGIAEKRLRTNVGNDNLQDVYFEAKAFSRIAKMFDEHFTMFIEVVRSEVIVTLFCLDPSNILKNIGKNFRSKVYFSATLSPSSYYIDMLGGNEDDDLAISFPSPFSNDQNDVFIYPLSTKYRNREQTKLHIAFMLINLITERPGNYFIFFPSYQYMNMVYEAFMEEEPEIESIVQKPNMTEEERDVFLASFKENNEQSFIGFAVMGGIFSEGIDLVGDRLNGVIVVGVGLPQIGLERNVIKDYFNQNGKNGYDYAYVYPGMNKVLQAGGRLIRSEEDTGTIVLIDDRFLTNKYLTLLPDIWRDFKVIH